MAETPLVVARKAAAWLRERGVADPRLDSELLLAGVLGLSRLELYLQYERPLTPAELESYRDAVRRRGRREPLQYIVGTTHFRELVLRVDRRALIPRPETEVLVAEVLKWATSRAAEAGQPLAAADIGTGTGAIALSLAQEGPFARVVATDVSRDALALARENAEACGLAARVELREGRGVEALEPAAYDVVVSNPPYVAEEDRAGLAPEVREWEPAGALFAGKGGYAVLEALVAGAPARLRGGGLLALEVGAAQATRVAGLVTATPGYESAQIVKDLSGIERIVLAQCRESERDRHA